MALTVAGSFAALEASILPTPTQISAFQPKVNTAQKFLIDTFTSTTNIPLLRTKLIGSAAHGTLIRPVNDIDMMAVFDISQEDFAQYYDRNPQGFIQRVKGAFKTSRVETVGVRGQAVRLFYTDKIHVDIAPMFEHTYGGYLLPAGDGTWLQTDPDVQEQWLRQRISLLGGSLVPLIRLMKKWNVVHGNQLKSYHLTVMVATAFVSLDGNRAEAVSVFLDWAVNNLSATDPAGYSGDLSSYLTMQAERDIRTRLTNAAERARSALYEERKGNHREAIRLWEIEFGSDFPAYG